MSYADAGHRPHAIHTGEKPENPITYGPESIRVELDTWGPQQDCFPALYDMLVSNWGDEPSRTIHNHEHMTLDPSNEYEAIDEDTGWYKLTPQQRTYVEGGQNPSTSIGDVHVHLHHRRRQSRVYAPERSHQNRGRVHAARRAGQ